MPVPLIVPQNLHFFGLTPDGLDCELAGWGWPKYRAQQVRDWVYQKLVSDPAQMTNLGKAERQALADRISFFTANSAVQQTSTDGTIKLLLTWPATSASAETVMIPDGPRRTACVSSQAGCPVGCKFCASGIGGVKSNLTAGQIVEQVYALDRVMEEGSEFRVRGSAKAPAPAASERINHIVFMGMGEPLANYANVLTAVRILHDPKCFNIGARKITISTVGVPAKMRQLAGEDLPLNLALSLHAPNEALRRKLIPWAEHFALDDILDAARYYFNRTGREVTLEYILLSGVNDRPEHARQLVQVCRTLRANVNLIRYNEVESLPYIRPKAQDVVEFQAILRRGGVNAHVRKSRGRDIDAACGQLRRREEAKAASAGLSGFTLLETLVLLGIFIILLTIFIPYVQSRVESNRRIVCADNLYTIRNAMQDYAKDNGRDFPRVVYDATNNPDGYTAFTGADDDNPFAPASAVKPNDVTASLWLLVRVGYVIDTRIFVCPSTDDTRDFMTDASGQIVPAKKRGNFRKPGNLSYSYASPFSSAAGYRLNDTKPAAFALMADRNPGIVASQLRYDAPDEQLTRANSSNHDHAGQNVLYADGSVKFMRTPYCGVGPEGKKQPGDNIYTARSSRPTTQAAELSPSVIGVMGMDVAPVRDNDSYLVPTATDPYPLPHARIVAPPTTEPRLATHEPATTSTARLPTSESNR